MRFDATAASQFWDLMQTKTFILPSCWDYPVWDEFMYSILCFDEIRLKAYENVIRTVVRGKAIVEVGTGASLPLALMCVKNGATIIYAIESDESAAQSAITRVRRSRLSDKIRVIHGISTEIDLPEKVDICVSEIIGGIGSSEGVIPILRDARRFLKADPIFIPERCITKVAPIQLPDNLYTDELIQAVAQYYVKAVGEVTGEERSATRYELYNLPLSHVLAAPRVFETIDFTKKMAFENTSALSFDIQTNGNFDGFLFWINLYVDSTTVIDSFRGTAWGPIFLPTATIQVHKGDTIRVDCTTTLGSNKINPDYFITGEVHHRGSAYSAISIASNY